jgi:hypothetical protein
MKRLVLLSIVVLVVMILAGCTYTMKMSEDGTRVWYSQREPSVGGPVVFECCDACGKGGRPMCWEAIVSK